MLKETYKLYKKYQELVNYLLVGVMTTIVSLGVYYGSVLTFLNPRQPVQLQIANLLSWILAVAFAYFTNRKFVFGSKDKNILYEITKFYLSRIGTLLVDMGIMFVGVTVFSYNDKVIKLVVQVIVTITNYIISKFLVFRKV